MRLGFPVRVFGLEEQAWRDPEEEPAAYELSQRLATLGDVVRYLHARRIRLYRLHAQMVPSWAAGDADAWRRQLDQDQGMLDLVGAQMRAQDLRVTLHPYSNVVLSTPDEEQALQSVGLIEAQAALLIRLGCGREARIVLHVGGSYGDAAAAAERFARRVEGVSPQARAHLVVEHDDRRYSFCDVLSLHRRCGLPVVLDTLHHQVLNPEGVPVRQALELALATWGPDTCPLTHFSTARTEFRREPNGRIKTPTWTEHGDYVDPFAFIAFLRLASGLPDYDIMLEAKARDLALLQLRRDVRRFAPDLADRADCSP
jgi:UV DNA damage endonuclease